MADKWPERDCALVEKYLRNNMPEMPYPWMGDQSKTGTHTLHYARMLLDALAGDERRTDLRRLLSLYKRHNGPKTPHSQWRRATYFMVTAACLDLCEILPYKVLAESSMGPARSEWNYGLSGTRA